jgi:hypothetical protein
MGLAEWWDRWLSPPPPDPYHNRPAEFQHRCGLPAARRPGTTWACGACGCQWIVQKGYQVTADTTVAVDPSQPWLGSKTEAVTYWHDKPYWSFDFGAYSRNRTVTGVEDRLSTHPQVVRCAVVWVSDASLGEVPRVFIDPVPNQDLTDLERTCYWLLRESIDVSILNPQTIQYGSLPCTPEGEVDKVPLRQIGSFGQSCETASPGWQQVIGAYGAIAYSPSTGRYGWSVKASDRWSAERAAVNFVGAGDAGPVVWGRSCYLALAIAGGGQYSGTCADSEARAEDAALSACDGVNPRIATVIDTSKG